MKNIWLLLGLFQAGASTADVTLNNGLPTYRTVGPGASCHFNTSNGATLQDGLNSGVPELRLVNTVPFVGTYTPPAGIYVRGGFNSCTDANNDFQGNDPSIIDGDGLGSTLSFPNNGAYVLELIRITNGAATDPAPDNTGGGLNITALDMTLKLDRVVIDNNQAELGAGIYKLGSGGLPSNVLLTMVDSSIENNTTITGGFGGGIYFAGAGELVAYGNTLITRNEATYGGGLFLKDATATIVVGPTTLDSGFIANKATLNAGAIYTNNSTLEITGGLKDVAGVGLVGLSGKNYLIMDNLADSDANSSGVGGAMFIYNNSHVILNAVSVVNNQAYESGGAIYAYQGTVLDVGLPENSNCQTTTLNGCNFFINNKAILSGGALYATSNTVSSFQSVNFNGNRAANGTVVQAFASTVNIFSSVMYNNGNFGANGYGDRNSLGTYSGGTLNIEQVTAVKNRNIDSFIQASNGSDLLNSFNNYFYNPQSGPWLTVFGGTATVVNHDCQVVDVNNNLSDSTHHLFTATATDNDQLNFIDELNKDFHLADSSVLVDFVGTFCPPNPNLINNGRDIDNDPRTLSADLGADENLSNDIIFENDFEHVPN